MAPSKPRRNALQRLRLEQGLTWLLFAAFLLLAILAYGFLGGADGPSPASL